MNEISVKRFLTRLSLVAEIFLLIVVSTTPGIHFFEALFAGIFVGIWVVSSE